MKSNDTEIIDLITTSIFFVYRYIFWIFCVLGIVGHLLNIYVFTRSCFRSNPCSLYFLASTLANLILVWFFIPLKILQYGFDIDLKSASLVFCKLYYFINESMRILSSWFLTLACIDRYWLTSSNIGIRQLSTAVNTRFIIFLFTIFIWLVNIHTIIFYMIDHQLHKCIPTIGIYQLFDRIYFLIMSVICPLLLMCICSTLILNNIRQERKRISLFMIEIVNNHHIIRKKRKIDNQIYCMLIVQCLIFFIMNITYFIHHIYLISQIFKENNRSLHELMIDSYFYDIAVFICLIGYCITFYFFILSSQLFRREVVRFGKKISHYRQRLIQGEMN